MVRLMWLEPAAQTELVQQAAVEGLKKEILGGYGQGREVRREVGEYNGKSSEEENRSVFGITPFADMDGSDR